MAITNPYRPPTARVADRQERQQAPALWNPNAAANWSLLFSPAFGSFLHMLNWRALDETDKAATSKGWFIASLIMLAAYLVLALAFIDSRAVDGATRTLGLVYLFVWYFSAGRAQAKYIKEKFGKTYPRKEWAKPLMIGVLGSMGYLTIAIAVGVLIGVAKEA
jgi:hypothetical protein